VHPEVRATTWEDLNQFLYDGTWNPSLGRYRGRVAYRGLSDASYTLKTSLVRLGGDTRTIEHHLLRNFRKYAFREAYPRILAQDSVWSWLCLGQHFGLATRLLDWTFSPYVALHFATANIDRFGEDGVVWCVDYTQVHKLLPAKLKRPLAAQGANVLTNEMLNSAAETLPAFEKLGRSKFVLFFEPPSLDERVINQYSLFSVTSDPMVTLDDWLILHPTLYRRIVIPAALKWEIRDKLDQANLNDRTLMGGLGGLCTWLNRHYFPKP
jgi:hypothetical protein